MKILILGATGGTGPQLLVQALEDGHDVTVLARSQGKIAAWQARVRLMIGSVTDDEAAIGQAVRGQDAVVSALGVGTSLRSAGLIQRSVPGILAAMQTHGVCRLIFTSAIGVGESIDEAPLFPRIMARLLLRDIYADKATGESLIRHSRLD